MWREDHRDIVGTGTLCSEAGTQAKIYDKRQRGQGRCEGSSICIGERESLLNPCVSSMFCDCETANLIERGKNSLNSDTALTRQQPVAGIPFVCFLTRPPTRIEDKGDRGSLAGILPRRQADCPPGIQQAPVVYLYRQVAIL
jgi:hypothetical protein